LAAAANVMARDPAALQLRLLQTVVEVAAEKNSTLVMPVPVELLRFFEKNAPPPQGESRAAPEDLGDAEVQAAEAAIEHAPGHDALGQPDIPPVPEVEAPPVPELEKGSAGDTAAEASAAEGDGAASPEPDPVSRPQP
ncbi:MAG TPA: slipin family protein, partial [Streptosporangiaceae bacterium]|nr:slipin family protein [Streptosporangiaceae bacterium]